MKKILLVLALALLASTGFAANDNDLNVVVFTFPGAATSTLTTAAETASSSFILSLPQSITIDSVQVINRAAISSDTSDYVQVVFQVDGVGYGTFTSSGTSMVADTPLALTPTTTKVAKDSEISADLRKVGSGQITTKLSLQVNYHNAQ